MVALLVCIVIAMRTQLIVFERDTVLLVSLEYDTVACNALFL